eukprot:2561110-Karenia_brevis.AAC.1
MELSACYDEDGTIAQDFKPATSSPWTDHQFWQDMEPQWNRYLKKLASGESSNFAYVCPVCNITQPDDYQLNCINDNK